MFNQRQKKKMCSNIVYQSVEEMEAIQALEAAKLAYQLTILCLNDWRIRTCLHGINQFHVPVYGFVAPVN